MDFFSYLMWVIVIVPCALILCIYVCCFVGSLPIIFVLCLPYILYISITKYPLLLILLLCGLALYPKKRPKTVCVVWYRKGDKKWR
jgi:hypothetical protein